MGVYIPNEDMPKDCYTCFCYETEFNMCSLTGKRLGDIRIRQDDCPLIEIDLVRCGECKYRDPEDKKCDSGMLERQGCIFPVDDDYFCKYGERRADE